MATHSNTLAWKIPWTEEPGGLQSMGSLRVRHDWATSLSLFLSRTGEGNGNPLQCSCLENPRDGGAWWAAVYGVTQSQTRLKQLSSSSSSSTRPSRTNTQKWCLFIIEDWNGKVGSQEIPGVTGKFGLGVQNEVGQRLREFCQENTLVIANIFFQQHKRWFYTWTSPDGQCWNQIVTFFAAEDGEALYSQQKQDWELTQIMNSELMAQIMNPLLQNSDLNWRK